jgi:hypothetical protein
MAASGHGRTTGPEGARDHRRSTAAPARRPGTCRQRALTFRSVTDTSDPEDAPSALEELTGYELWDRTQRAGQQVAAAGDRLIGAPSARARVDLAPEFLQPLRQLLTLRLVAVARARRRAFPVQVPPAGSHGVAALWAEVFWAARARSPDDDSGVLQATDVSIRGLLALEPSDLADPDAVRAWWERLELVEETFDGLDMEAQATAEGLAAAAEHQQQVRRGAS